MSLLEVLETVEVVQAVEEARRKPAKLAHLTFFSVHDLWDYFSEEDDRTCQDCSGFNGSVWRGSDLIAMFPAMSIESDTSIAVNLHNHCRCLLMRRPRGD